jgi:hypothetical protein
MAIDRETEQRRRMRHLADTLIARRKELRLSREKAIMECTPEDATEPLSLEWYKRIEAGLRPTLLPWELRCLSAGLRIRYEVLLHLTGYIVLKEAS